MHKIFGEFCKASSGEPAINIMRQFGQAAAEITAAPVAPAPSISGPASTL